MTPAGDSPTGLEEGGPEGHVSEGGLLEGLQEPR